MPTAISHYWEQSDQFGHLIAYLLLLMSIVSWTLLLSKAWFFLRMRRASAILPHFWAAPGLPEALALLSEADSEVIFIRLATSAAEVADVTPATPSSGLFVSLGAGTSVEALLTRQLRQELQALTTRLESGLSILASVAATAPFVGLLGTVWGIYHALTAISATGTIQIDQLAGPVGEALIMTAFGLMVAIPAVLAYNGLSRRCRIVLAELDGFAHDLHAHFSQASNHGGRAGSRVL
ncbi:MotA/TolQ/ExbB proton channel family protein [Undibacterium sp. SXout7W]|uniref:MotA/TolQ/ExbB proton channel family protein n=1 Tax=Undibacterium sp. SXout7W TaxID=3413049 RepID=UPI003BF199E5